MRAAQPVLSFDFVVLLELFTVATKGWCTPFDACCRFSEKISSVQNKYFVENYLGYGDVEGGRKYCIVSETE